MHAVLDLRRAWAAVSFNIISLRLNAVCLRTLRFENFRVVSLSIFGLLTLFKLTTLVDAYGPLFVIFGPFRSLCGSFRPIFCSFWSLLVVFLVFYPFRSSFVNSASAYFVFHLGLMCTPSSHSRLIRHTRYKPSTHNEENNRYRNEYRCMQLLLFFTFSSRMTWKIERFILNYC